MSQAWYNRKSAFTLIEIMIVVAIIGLIAVLALPAFAKARKNSIRAKCIDNMQAVYNATVRYEIDHSTTLYGIRSDGIAIRNTFVSDGYVKSQDNFDCPASQTKDYDDYLLVYVSGSDLTSVSCTIVPATHVLP
ncbi:MAG: type II secretion system protein [Verrucomicrobiota bacterium]